MSQENYNKALEKNFLYSVYRYSYLMNVFKVLEDRKQDKTEVNYGKFWIMIQNDCKIRIQNLSQEMKNNPAIDSVLQNYENNTRKLKMIINDNIDGRENDYIIFELTCVVLMVIMDMTFNGMIDNQPILKIITSYQSKEVMFLDSHIVDFVVLRLAIYANNDCLERT